MFLKNHTDFNKTTQKIPSYNASNRNKNLTHKRLKIKLTIQHKNQKKKKFSQKAA